MDSLGQLQGALAHAQHELRIYGRCVDMYCKGMAPGGTAGSWVKQWREKRQLLQAGILRLQHCIEAEQKKTSERTVSYGCATGHVGHLRGFQVDATQIEMWNRYALNPCG